jgi:hypothetical protein
MTITIVRILAPGALALLLTSAACSAAPSDAALFGPDRAEGGAAEAPDAGRDTEPAPDRDAGTTPVADAADGAAPACARRTGIYQFTQSFQTGNCGTTQFVSNFDYAGCAQAFCLPYAAEARGETDIHRVFPACVGSVKPSADGCRTEYDYTCTTNDGTKLKYVGVTVWDAAGTSGSDATQTYTTFTAAGVTTCSGQYQVTIRKP